MQRLPLPVIKPIWQDDDVPTTSSATRSTAPMLPRGPKKRGKPLMWKLEPAVGFEPTTDGLQNRCSTTELSWRRAEEARLDWLLGQFAGRIYLRHEFGRSK